MSAESKTTPARIVDSTAAPALEPISGHSAKTSAVPAPPAPPADPSLAIAREYSLDPTIDRDALDLGQLGDHNVCDTPSAVYVNSPTYFAEIPTTQHLVLVRLWRGDSIAQIAQANNLSRSTIHRWMRNDARFIAAMNQGCAIHRMETEARMCAMSDEAMDNMAKAIRRGDVNASKFAINHVMKARPGSLSPRVIAKRIARRNQREKDFLNSPDEAPATPRISSKVGKPPALLADSDASVQAEKKVDGKGTKAPSHPGAPEPRSGTTAENRTSVERNGKSVKRET